MTPPLPKLYVITGPSAAGKKTVYDTLTQQFSQLHPIRLVTTKQPGMSDKFGEPFYYLDQARFEWLHKTNQILPMTTNYYTNGLLTTDLAAARHKNHAGIIALPFADALQLETIMTNVKLVFLDFPSQSIQHQRLSSRYPKLAPSQMDEILSEVAVERAQAAQLSRDRSWAIIINDHLGACVQDTTRFFGLTS